MALQATAAILQPSAVAHQRTQRAVQGHLYLNRVVAEVDQCQCLVGGSP